MTNNVYGIDLGTCNMKIYCKSSNKILNEKNTIALKNKDEIYAYGNSAYAMYEKAPESIHVTFPVTTGVIADFNNLQSMIQLFLETHVKGSLKGAEFIVAVPTSITEVEKKAFFDMFYKSKMKPKSVLLCEKPIADAVGLGLDVNEPTGIMVVDIGADTTEISVISLGGLVLSDLLHFGGNKIDESIITYVKRNYNLVIGQKTAQSMKERLGSGIPGNEDTMIVVMDGYKATETIRELSDEGKAHIPIVALTANAFEEDRKMAISKGMNDHIAKPIDVKKVEEVIISVLK